MKTQPTPGLPGHRQHQEFFLKPATIQKVVSLIQGITPRAFDAALRHLPVTSDGLVEAPGLRGYLAAKRTSSLDTPLPRSGVGVRC